MADPLILVTRPEPDCSALARQLEASGVGALCVPAFRFEARSPDPATVEAWRRAPRRLAVFTSPRAVAFGLQAVPPADLAAAAIAAVGPATARSLGRRGLRVLQPDQGGYTSEALLEHPDLQHPGLRRQDPAGDAAALIFAAPGGRRLLLERLAARGWRTALAEVYQRVALPPDAGVGARIEKAGLVISLWTSAIAMDELLPALAGPVRQKVLDGVFVVISPRLEEYARRHGAATVRQATGPDNEALARCAREAAARV